MSRNIAIGFLPILSWWRHVSGHGCETTSTILLIELWHISNRLLSLRSITSSSCSVANEAERRRRRPTICCANKNVVTSNLSFKVAKSGRWFFFHPTLVTMFTWWKSWRVVNRQLTATLRELFKRTGQSRSSPWSTTINPNAQRDLSRC